MNSEKRPSTLYNHSFTCIGRNIPHPRSGCSNSWAKGPHYMKREGGSISDITCLNFAELLAIPDLKNLVIR